MTLHQTLLARLASIRLPAAALSLAVFVIAASSTVTGFAQSYGAPVRDADRTFQKHVCSWLDLKRSNVVIQKRDYSCGAASLATVIQYYWGDYITEDRLIHDLEATLSGAELADRVRNGLALTDLRRLAVRQGYLATMGQLSFHELTNAKIPLIVGIVANGYDHFVVFRGFDGEWVYLADPTRGNIRVPSYQFVEEWQQNTVLVVAKPDSEPRNWSPLSVTQDDTAVGATNWQLLRTLPPSVISNPTSR